MFAGPAPKSELASVTREGVMQTPQVDKQSWRGLMKMAAVDGDLASKGGPADLGARCVSFLLHACLRSQAKAADLVGLRISAAVC